MDFKKLTIVFFIDIIICELAIVCVNLIIADVELINGLIAEIIGGGLLGALVAGLFFYLQQDDEYNTNKSKARGFYNDKLLLAIKESFSRNKSPWNLSGGKKFYFDNSRINHLFDVYESNFNDINQTIPFMRDDELLIEFREFYKEIREGYVLGEKIEGVIYQVVRRENHKRNLISANDFFTQAYIKGKAFANLTDNMIMRYLELQSIPQSMKDILTKSKKDKTFNELIKQLRKKKKALGLREEKMRILITNKQP